MLLRVRDIFGISSLGPHSSLAEGLLIAISFRKLCAGAARGLHNFCMKERTRLALLLAAAILVYGNTLVNDFAQDDDIYILQNHAVTAHSFRELSAPNYFSHVFRPLTFATFSFDWFVAGPRPLGYHLVNLLLHASVTLLVYLLLRKLLEVLPEHGSLAFVAALLFAVHPIHTEAVAAIVGRSELLAAGFLLAAWRFHLRDRYLLALLGFALALFSKESAISFLPMVLIGDYARSRPKPPLRYASFAGVTALYLGVFWKLQGGRFGTVIPFLDNPLVNLPAGLRVLNALRVAWKYVGLQVYPAALSCDYSYAAITLYSNKRLLWAALATASVIALWIWALFTRRSAWSIAGAIYLAGFAVTANLLFPIGTIMGERLAYFPSIGFCLLAALLWLRLANRQRTAARVLLIAVCVALSARTIVRNRDWRDNFTLYTAALRVVPDSAKMHSSIAVEYALRGQVDVARREFQTALRIYPDFTEALESFGLLESNLGHDEDARRLLESALALAQKGSVNYNFAAANLAAQYLKLGETDKALKLLDQLIADSPTYARAWANRAALHYKRGELYTARHDAETALRLDSANSQAKAVLSRLVTSPSPGAPQ
jgi:Tfp pilus assembly protein PilF